MEGLTGPKDPPRWKVEAHDGRSRGMGRSRCREMQVNDGLSSLLWPKNFEVGRPLPIRP